MFVRHLNIGIKISRLNIELSFCVSDSNSHQPDLMIELLLDPTFS